MMDFKLDFVEEFIDDSRRCTRPLELRDALMTHISKLGFDDMSALDLQDGPSLITIPDGPKGNAVRIGTYSEDWTNRYFHQSYQNVDPVWLKMKTETSPFYWQDCFKEREEAVGWSELGIQFKSESEECGLVRGLTVAIDNSETSSRISFCGKEARGGPGVMHMMHLIGIYFHQRLLAMSGALSLKLGNSKVRLTPRETEVLHWYANGKSAWDISVVLSVSEAAVRFHLSNIRDKYGVPSSVHATALAISRSDIQI